MKIKTKELPLLIFSLALPLVAGFIGSLFTFQSIPTWYVTLVKPPISPPNWVFGPVWTTLYLLMGTSFIIVLKSKKSKEKKEAIKYFYKQLFLNTLWSIAFFGFRSPILGVVVIVVLWILILKTIISFSKISIIASQLLYPYLAWVSFASVLNFWIFIINR